MPYVLIVLHVGAFIILHFSHPISPGLKCSRILLLKFIVLVLTLPDGEVESMEKRADPTFCRNFRQTGFSKNMLQRKHLHTMSGICSLLVWCNSGHKLVEFILENNRYRHSFNPKSILISLACSKVVQISSGQSICRTAQIFWWSSEVVNTLLQTNQLMITGLSDFGTQAGILRIWWDKRSSLLWLDSSAMKLYLLLCWNVLSTFCSSLLRFLKFLIFRTSLVLKMCGSVLWTCRSGLKLKASNYLNRCADVNYLDIFHLH